MSAIIKNSSPIPLRKILPKSNSTEILAWNEKENGKIKVKNKFSSVMQLVDGNKNQYQNNENYKFLPKEDDILLDNQINNELTIIFNNHNKKLNTNINNQTEQQQQQQQRQQKLICKNEKITVAAGDVNYKQIFNKKLNLNCCQWKIPWILFINSFIQICVHIWKTDDIFKILVFSPFKKKELWRFLSYNFLHIGYTHLMLNIFIQIIVSVPLETEQGHLRVLIIYVGGVIFGALAATIFQPTLLMVGSSAGVYSLLISHISNVVMNFTALTHRYLRIICVTILCTSDIIFVISHYYYGNNSEPKISISAHCGGALAGLLLGFIIFTGSKTFYIRLIQLLAFILCFSILIISIIYNIYVEVPKL